MSDINIQIRVERLAMNGRRAVIEVSTPIGMAQASKEITTEACYCAEKVCAALGIEPWEPDEVTSSNIDVVDGEVQDDPDGD